MTVRFIVTSTLDDWPSATGTWYIDVVIECPTNWGGVSTDYGNILTEEELQFNYDLV